MQKFEVVIPRRVDGLRRLAHFWPDQAIAPYAEPKIAVL